MRRILRLQLHQTHHGGYQQMGGHSALRGYHLQRALYQQPLQPNNRLVPIRPQHLPYTHSMVCTHCSPQCLLAMVYKTCCQIQILRHTSLVHKVEEVYCPAHQDAHPSLQLGRVRQRTQQYQQQYQQRMLTGSFHARIVQRLTFRPST